MSKAKIAAVEKRLIRIRSEITAIGSFLPGSITKQYNVCGNKNCKCKDPVNPKNMDLIFNLLSIRKESTQLRLYLKKLPKT